MRGGLVGFGVAVGAAVSNCAGVGVA